MKISKKGSNFGMKSRFYFSNANRFQIKLQKRLSSFHVLNGVVKVSGRKKRDLLKDAKRYMQLFLAVAVAVPTVNGNLKKKDGSFV